MNDQTELLEALLSSMNPEEVLALRCRAITMQIAYMMHTILCISDHEKDCDFYKEEISTERSAAREEWYNRTVRVLEKSGLSTLDELKFIRQQFPALLDLTSSTEVCQFLTVVLPSFLARAMVVRAAVPALPCASQSDPLDSDELPEQ